MPQLILLKGLPASGKSTWARETVRKFNGKHIRLSKDDFRQMLHDGEWSSDNEKIVIRMERSAADYALSNGYNVIIDDTNLNPKHEEAFREIAEKNNADFTIKMFDTDLQECIMRDRRRAGKSVGEKVIRKMHDQFIYKRPEKPEFKDNAPSAIIIDIDGTLADIEHRRHFIIDKDWSKFFAAMMDDKVNDWCKNIISNAKDKGVLTILCSGRPERFRGLTQQWLKKNDVAYDFLFMRNDVKADGTPDYRQDNIIKEEIYHDKIKDHFNIQFVIDDRQQVVDMWRKNGLTVLQCDYGDF